MSSTTSPVNGNQFFTRNVDQAAQTDQLNVNTAVVGSLNATTCNSAFCFSNATNAYQGKKLYSVKANVPTGSLPLAFGTAYWLNANPGTTSATTAAGGVLQLPAGATIVSAFYADPTAAGPTAFNIGTATITGGAATTSNNIFNTMVIASAIAGTVVGVSNSVAPAAAGAFGGAGLATGGAAIAVSSTVATGVSITATVANLTASSGVLTLYYLL